MLKREWDAESNGKLPHLFIPSKTAALVSEFLKTCLEQNGSLGAGVCSERPALGQNTPIIMLGVNTDVQPFKTR